MVMLIRIILIILILGLHTPPVWPAGDYGPIKVYRGPETEKLTMLEQSDGKKVIVKFEGIGGEWEGKTLLFDQDTASQNSRELYWQEKVGSKWRRFTALRKSNGAWTLYPKGKSEAVALTFSEKATQEADSKLLIESLHKKKEGM